MTPALAPLILPAISASVSVEVTATSIEGLVPTAKLPALHLPVLILSVPSPTAPAADNASEVDTCALASCETVTLNVVSTVPPMAEAVMSLSLDELAETAFQPVMLDSLPTAPCSVDTSDCSLPNVEILASVTLP